MPHTLRNASRCHVSCRRKICIDAHIQIRVVHVLILNNLFLLPNITRWINSLQNISSSLWSHINPPWICKPFLFEGINNWPNLCHKFWGWWGDDNPSNVSFPFEQQVLTFWHDNFVLWHLIFCFFYTHLHFYHSTIPTIRIIPTIPKKLYHPFYSHAS